MKPLQLTDDALVLDASAVEQCYMRCPREFYYNQCEAREKNTLAEGRSFGAFLHDCFLEAYYNGTTLSAIHEEMTASWDVTEFAEDSWRTLALAHDIVDMYAEQYPRANEPFAAIGQPEQSFCLPLGLYVDVRTDSDATRRVPVLWSGKIDLITRWRADLSGLIVDHKTSSVAGPTYWAQWRNSTAQYMYAWAAMQMGIGINAFMINAIFIRQPTKTGKGVTFERQLYPVTEDGINRAARNLRSTIKHLAENNLANYWPMNTVECVRKYGECQYLETCRMETGAEALLNTNLYKPRTWTPLV